MALVFEYLTIKDVVFQLAPAILWRKAKRAPLIKALFWIDASRAAIRLATLICSALGIPAEELHFQLAQTRNTHGELIRIQIPRNDLFSFWSLIDESNSLSSRCPTNKKGERFLFFLQKELLSAPLVSPDSISRVLYMIHVVAQSEVVQGYGDRLLVLKERPWKKEYVQYAAPLGVRLRWTGQRWPRLKFRNLVMSILYKMRKAYNLLRKVRGAGVRNPDPSHPSYLFIQGRGDARLVNDGNNSDLDWVLQSGFPRDRVVYLCLDEASRTLLEEGGVQTVSSKDTRAYIHTGSNGRYYTKCMTGGLGGREKIKLRELDRDYRLLYGIWSGFFSRYGVKVFMTWYKYDGQHAVMADAIQALGGISAVNQVTFDGYRNYECRVSADLAFGFSRFSAQIEQESLSNVPYYVVTGYPRDHARPLLEAQAQKLRMRLGQAGARKIVFVIDENSIKDARYHMGNASQQENYRFVLEKVLELPWLGVVFKPKAPHTLRERLGEVNELLCAAERTGRCVVLEGRHFATSIESVLLAGLASDVCIHGHLAAGTAALECALAGLPTLLIDREHVPFSKLNELPRGKVVFEDWPTAMEAVMEHLTSETGIPGFGDWGGMLDELDPFRDGKASYRIGTYLRWLLEGFDKGWDREHILADAANRYMEQWGADKVVPIGQASSGSSSWT